MDTNIELKGELGVLESRPPTEESKPPPNESKPPTEESKSPNEGRPSTDESSSSDETTSTTDQTSSSEQREQTKDTSAVVRIDNRSNNQVPIKVETQTIDYFPKTNEQTEPLFVTWVGIFLVIAVISYHIIDRKMNK
ncbi:hypothetical protein [Enterococcus mundtii]|uniref:LPXTG cell wall anchor domain-containing protein n=1 Tax=Enterococcus mundtii TaxID=53346 RepID=A0A2S7RWG3_ENTMU|nr:hypothetical protein [Enterococcus mundtii]PQF24273.1 hypothetical protein CUS89_04590 [Enterococcus mundtii]PTO39175.1 hypothetical protein C6P52_06040 [Enterococcus mundtii]PTO42752.1 hypothetical protein C6P54_11385 [Enterococcus mundtii]